MKHLKSKKTLLFGGILCLAVAATLNSSADASVKALWPYQLRN